MRYFVIGDEDTVLGLGMAGVSGKSVTDAAQAAEAFNTAISDKHTGIVIITEKVADMIRATVDRYIFTQTFPLIVEIPDRKGRIPGRPDIRQLVNKTIGLKV
ncbi:MAG: V-type ATP synthase subunit F [Candidatus Pacearchaeota archaeon]|nr:V-type ATP synthase subunit F [Candidatus Pacearchaeota archaeon]